MHFRLAVLALCACSSVAFAQSFEIAVSGGQSQFTGNKSLGTATSDPASGQYTMKDGFRLAFRLTFNQGRFFGHEIGYAYNRTSIDIPPITTSTLTGTTTTPAQNISVPIHQGFYNFLVYATPEGTHVRPFGTGGVQFSSFVPPGASVSYGTQTTKYGINYGGGLKVRITSIWGVRFDVRWYNTSKPFNFPNQTGRLQQLEIDGGLTFNL
jgi:opacity protein-like surface antigen